MARCAASPAGGAAKAQFEDLTIELCGKLLPEEAAAKTLEKLNRKKAKDWRNVGAASCTCQGFVVQASGTEVPGACCP
jgi:hypothetical protein